MNRKLYISLFLLLQGLLATSQDLTVSISAPKVVRVGEQFRVTYSLNQDVSTFDPGGLDGFQVLGGPSTSSSSSIQIINGQVTQNKTISYSYILQAGKEGKYTIGPAVAKNKGKTAQSNTIAIEVVAGSAGNAGGTQNSNAGGNNQQQSKQETDIPNEQLFIKTIVSKRDVYQGEQIAATLKLYSKISVNGLENLEQSGYAGFYKEDIEVPPLRNLDRENINGEIYLTGILGKVLLTPQRNGELTIDPASIDVLMQQRVSNQPRSVFDEFFGSSYRTIRKRISSPAIKINVKPLPGSRPAGFEGAVGSYSLSSTIDKQEVKTNEAITLKLKISGTGNIKLLNDPAIDFPPSLEVYDPKVAVNATPGANGTTGSKTFEYLIIPRYAGEYTIPAVPFAYFDPATGSYKSLSTPAYAIKVDKGEDSSPTGVISGLTKEELQYVGQDIRFIKTSAGAWAPKGTSIYNNPSYYAAYVGSALLFLLLYVLRRKNILENADIARVRNRKASKIAIKRLKTAKSLMETDKQQAFTKRC
ncbi:MAG: protein BatD [Bacteroidales bacterium]|nr:protein BatD [Bacteroidales bacterium]